MVDQTSMPFWALRNMEQGTKQEIINDVAARLRQDIEDTNPELEEINNDGCWAVDDISKVHRHIERGYEVAYLRHILGVALAAVMLESTS